MITALGAIERVRAALLGRRFPLEDEKQTQAAIAAALDSAGIRALREVPMCTPRKVLGVIDFLAAVPCGGQSDYRIGIEVKIKGTQADIRRQIARYAADPVLAGLVLATSKPVALPSMLGDIPVAVVDLGRAWL